RLYFATRDEQGRSQVARTELTLPLGSGGSTRSIEDEPVIRIGPLGAYDDSGVTCSSLVRAGGKAYLYFSGWSLGRTVPFYICTGCAISTNGDEFEKVSPAPILGRDRVDPYLAGHPSVLLDGGVWRMWYASGTEWTQVNGRPRHRYHVKYAESRDGIEWRRDGTVCIDYTGPNEYAIGRPFVLRDGNTYRMWYSTR